MPSCSSIFVAKLFHMNQNTNTNKFIKAWNKLPILFRAVSSGFLVSTIGVAAWSVMLLSIPAPWSVLPMVIVLWIFWKYFSGKWGSKKSTVTKKEIFGKTRLTLFFGKWVWEGAFCLVPIIRAFFFIFF